MALLLVATNIAVGAVTVVAYNSYLVGRLDSELATATQRSNDRPQGESPGSPPTGTSTSAPTPGSPAEGSASQPDPDNAFIGAPGQAANTVIAIFNDGTTVLAGYTDAQGAQHSLTTAQERTLRHVRATAAPVTVSLGSLGSYRAQAATADDDDVIITALPLGDLHASIMRLLVVIGSVTLAGLLIAVWAGAMLVRRSLRPLEHVAAVASGVTTLDLERGDTDIQARVAAADLRANREVGQVGTALNQLLGHVARALTVRRDAEAGMRAFVADASHELRTPIATVRAYAELTTRTQNPDDVHRNVTRIGTEAIRMGNLVEELLLLARLDAAAIADTAPAVHGPVDLTAIVVEMTMDARATALDHRWTLQVDPEPITVPGDDAELRRVVTNLLTNARTHTPADTAIVVSLQRVRDDVRFVVTNDGPAIPAETLPILFDRFTRGEASRSREYGTSGLGLAIVRAVIEAHGGTIRVVSDTARTAFTVTLPAGR
ncbi:MULTISPECIES: sensor histidine kinase [unclassified Curtobacterium]|uniref:sensor histidine kinase n=1 Tax=unclassified Curtobacterium TaxID=257496 RepID=UPI00226B6036|nr:MULTISPECIES: HAMP domain-containing sensor histidine kinase [unclassified Curtobacterium]